MTNIQHLFTDLQIADIQRKIFKNECLFSCESPYSSEGLFLCIKTLKSISKKFLNRYSQTFNSHCFLNYKYRRVIEKKEEKTIILPEFVSDSSANIKNLLNVTGIDEEIAKKINECQQCESIFMGSDANISSWEDKSELNVSKYAENLEQLPNGIKIPPKGWKCSKCDMTDNLWLNLTDGLILCGRKFWDGTGGNNHAVEHYEVTKYPLAVKLGTITPTGAEVYSYPEDSMVLDPKLNEHLTHWGINRMIMEKTDKTMTELEIKANDRFGDWLLLQETNNSQEPRFGPGLTGIFNLGNSCYMNSVIQCLFAIESFRENYAYPFELQVQNLLSSSGDLDREIINNLRFQFTKVGNSLCSGDYSFLGIDEKELEKKENGTVLPELPGIKPLLLRTLIGKNHPEFSTKRLQDAFEYFNHVMSFIERDSFDSNKIQTIDKEGKPIESGSALSSLMISVQNRIECGLTKKVNYQTTREYSLNIPINIEDAMNKADLQAFAKIEADLKEKKEEIKPGDIVKPRIFLKSCLERWTSEEVIDDWTSPCVDPPNQKTFAKKSQKLTNAPDYMWFVTSRFTIGDDWTPKKLDVELILTDKKLTKDQSETIQDINDYTLDLTHLYTPSPGLQPGEVQMPNNNENTASQQSTPTAFHFDPALIANIMELGFSEPAAKRAIKQTNGQGIEPAMAWILERIGDDTINDPYTDEDIAQDQTVGLTQVDKSTIDESDMALLMSMGIERNVAMIALKRFPKQLDVATDWAFNNPDAVMEPEDDEPATITTSNLKKCDTTKLALTNGPAKYKLCAMISHIGKTASHGHYIAHIRRSALNTKGIPSVTSGEKKKKRLSNDDDQESSGSHQDEWILFNDEKVQLSQQPPFGYAYMYLWKRCP